MPSTPSTHLGLQAPLDTEVADGPSLSHLLIDRLELTVGMVKLATVTPSSGKLTFTGIPGDFKHLKVIGRAKGVAFAALFVTLNNDNSFFYSYESTSADRIAAIQDGSGSNGGFPIGATDTSPLRQASFEFDVFHYSDAATWTVFKSECVYLDNTGPVVRTLGGWYNQATAITRVDIASGTLTAPSEATLYGII